MRRRHPLLAAALAIVLGAATAACSSTPDSPQAEEPPYARYVALGDSFTAGPYIPTTDLADGCLRSSGNYPRLLARRLDVDSLVDVSCSGADTGDLRRPTQTLAGAAVPAQVAALDGDTDLVTVGIGGNDFGLYGRLTSGQTTATTVATLTASATAIGQHVEEALRVVHRRAPDARVVLVGYLRLVDPGMICPSLLPFTREQITGGHAVQAALNEAMRQAAEATGTTFVDMFAASEGHGICSADPWVQGQYTDQNRASAYHPLAEGMDAVADQVEHTLEQEDLP